MNKNLFVSVMKREGETQAQLAEAMGLSPSRLNAKINEWNGAAFTQSEIRFVVSRYNLSNDEICAIFFDQKVSEKDTEREER